MPTEFANLRKTRLGELRDQQGCQFYKEIETCDLSPEHKMAGIRFCANEIDDPIQIPIVFTDEATVQLNLQKDGVQRRRGAHIPEALAVCDLHPGQVMVWSGISSDGY
jgi:hypothetical protein